MRTFGSLFIRLDRGAEMGTGFSGDLGHYGDCRFKLLIRRLRIRTIIFINWGEIC